MPDTDDIALNETGPAQTQDTDSIVDAVLDLDEALSGDVRRAERSARFCIKPHLTARLDRLNAEIEDLTDAQGNPLEAPGDQPLSSDGRDLARVMTEYRAVEDEYVKAMRTVTVAAMAPSRWEAFKSEWSKQVDSGQMSEAMRRELVVECAIKPQISLDQYAKLLDRYGESAMSTIAQQAWAACDHTGVDVPKSRAFSAAQRAQRLSQS